MKQFSRVLRAFGFWFFDFLKGSPVRTHYKEVSFILDHIGTSKSNDLREARLKAILEHAISTVPYYKGRIKGNRLSDFPVVNKDLIKAQFDSFRSDVFLNRKNKQVLTSGSTGSPFEIFQDRSKQDRQRADLIYFAKKGGYKLGTRLIFMKVWNDQNRKKPFRLWKENIKPYSVFNHADRDIENLLGELGKDRSKKAVLIFASTCDAIANYLDSIKAAPKNFNISSFITNSDALDRRTKSRMERYFKVPVLSRYSNMECGILAQQKSEMGTEFEINWASYHIELLHLDRDEPAEPGTLGRVVVTDLFNGCMPLIRYDTGDLAILAKSKINGAAVFERIEGRKADLIKDTSGKPITPYVVCANMWKYIELRQFQFVQKGEREYQFRLNPWTRPFLREEELLSEFRGYFGENASFSVRYTDEIPTLSSGKRKYVVNESGSEPKSSVCRFNPRLMESTASLSG